MTSTEQKKKSKKSKKEEEEEIIHSSPTKDDYVGQDSEKKKTKKHKKKDKKRKREEAIQEGGVDQDKTNDDNEEGRQEKASKSDDNGKDDDTKNAEKNSATKEKRKKRREERERLMEQVPLQDEHGISYTKQQLRRMRKRVARGLPPLETEEEARERQREDARLRKEEEAELQGMIYQKDGTMKHEGEEEDDGNEEEAGDVDEGGNMDDDNEVTEDAEDSSNNVPTDSPSKPEAKASPKKKSRRNKPVPSDYVCQACKNKETPLHWIYDCPLKVTMPGINHKSNKNHVNEPSELKVFVSGLPFDAKAKDVRGLFASCGKMKHCKLLTFPDTGRCKGQAFLTFETDEAAKAAIKLSGSPINGEEDDKESKGEKSRKALTLKVSKVLNRAITKKGGGKASGKA